MSHFLGEAPTVQSSNLLPDNPSVPSLSSVPGPTHVPVRRPVQTPFETIITEQLDLNIDQWNRGYNFLGFLRTVHLSDPRISDPAFLIIRIEMRTLVKHYQYLTLHNLRNIASAHAITYKGHSKQTITALLTTHHCNFTCQPVYYVFKEANTMRLPWNPNGPRSGFEVNSTSPFPTNPGPNHPNNSNHLSQPHVGRTLDSDTANHGDAQRPSPTQVLHTVLPDDVNGVTIGAGDTDRKRIDTTHLKETTEKTKRTIIKEWQQRMDLTEFLRQTCASCSELKFPHDLERIHASDVPLHVLRNDDLPDNVLPTSYNFDAYDRAILDPEGLENREERGWITVCPPCAKELAKGEMPRLALANWLYYARDKLPDDIRQAFNEMSIFEKTLVSRVRTNSILCRFTGVDPDINGATFTAGRRHIRGNIISTPMDTTRVYEVLPPSPRDVADTICALIVADSLPSRKNIDKLEPILVRKSRIELLIKFLLGNNSHYKLSESFRGFSAEHLEALFTGNKTSGVPDHVQIAHIATNEAIDGGVSDHIRRFDNLEGLFMENVSYTIGDHSPQSFREMTLKALQRCKEGKPFLYAKSGSNPVPDIGNPNWLSWAHPNADPFGLGGFHDPRRKKPIGMEVQLRHLLNVRDPFFENDPELAFDIYNITRKHAVNNTMRFCVPYTSYSRVVDDILKLNKNALERLQAKFRADHNYKPSSPDEVHVLRTMASISPVARHIPGTSAQKIKMRNEIRAIISQRGSPTLFVTLNPADYYNPIVSVLATRGKTAEDLAALEDLSTSDRASIAIQHPVACAQFFDAMIKAFIKVILRYDHSGKVSGIFGECDAYYGTVETQGRGSLHCHMLIWLRGHLPPETLQQALQTSEGYKVRLVNWLNSIVDTGFLGTRSFLNGRLDVNEDELGRTREPHPGSIKGSLGQPQSSSFGRMLNRVSAVGPSIDRLSKDAFEKEMKEHVDDLLLRFNWHIHSASCWKYLTPQEPRIAENCRFGMDGSVRPETTIDTATGSISVRRKHCRMTQFNPVMTFLLKCNTDIKFIGSGEDAKAFMYYVTDYITKSPLSMHAGLTALSYAIEQGESRGIFTDPAPGDSFSRRVMTLAINSMLGRQEISHPQVMSYIAGGGENYTSERFQAFNWAEVVKYVAKTFEDALADTANQELNMTVNREGEQINVCNQLLDYIYRPEMEPFESMGLYRHIATTTKSPRKKPELEATRRLRKDVGQPFSSDSHPQFHTRILTIRSKIVVPVLLGPRISKNKESEGERELWARDMCILFKPWRRPSDLKTLTDRWMDALDAALPSIDESDKSIMENMSLIAEGKSARDSRPRGRRRPEPDDLEDDDDVRGETVLEDEVPESETNAFRLLSQDPQPSGRQGPDLTTQLTEHLSRLIGVDSALAFQKCLPQPCSNSGSAHLNPNGSSPAANPEGLSLINVQQAFMTNCKNRRVDEDSTSNAHDGPTNRVDPEASRPSPSANQPQASGIRTAQDPTAAIQTLRDDRIPQPEIPDSWQIVDQIVEARNMRQNPDQLRAFEIIAHHVIEGGPQLLMFVGGKGGTGKSYLIESIVLLFEMLRISNQLRLGAPTGIAAALIGGNTLHSLLNIIPNNKKAKNDRLSREWRTGKYFIIDEVSMVGAHFMATISSRLKHAKADQMDECQKSFGGVNAIFMGDFYQLSPPKQPSLFANRLVKNPTFSQTRDNTGIDALTGAFLWRQIDTVVILKQSKRHSSDPRFSEILERIRTGTNIIRNGSLITYEGKTILEHLRQREISRIATCNPSELQQFQDAPVIVGSKIIRDALNASLLVAHAARQNEVVCLYHALDVVRGKTLTRATANRLRLLPTRTTNEALGLLPLFVGMKVMITENISVPYKIVNGTEGTVVSVSSYLDEDRNRVAEVVYVDVPGCKIKAPGLRQGVVPIFPTSVSIAHPLKIGDTQAKSFRRKQIPLVPAYSYTDYKSQGRTLERAIVDITSARGQGIYVMLSRVTSLQGLLILRWFPNSKIIQRMSSDLRTEIERLQELEGRTIQLHDQGTFRPVTTQRV